MLLLVLYVSVRFFIGQNPKRQATRNQQTQTQTKHFITPEVRDEYAPRPEREDEIRRERARKRVINEIRQPWSIPGTPEFFLETVFRLENFNYGGQGFGHLFVSGMCERWYCNNELPVDRGCPRCIQERIAFNPEMLAYSIECDSQIHAARLRRGTLCTKCEGVTVPQLTLTEEKWEDSPYDEERREIEREEDQALEDFLAEQAAWQEQRAWENALDRQQEKEEEENRRLKRSGRIKYPPCF